MRRGAAPHTFCPPGCCAVLKLAWVAVVASTVHSAAPKEDREMQLGMSCTGNEAMRQHNNVLTTSDNILRSELRAGTHMQQARELEAV